MDRHSCKLCFRRFSNGRALGGHMRSHAASATAAKPQLREYHPSPPSSSSSASRGDPEAAEQVAEVTEQEAAGVAAEGAAAVAGVEEDEAKQLAYYGLRENPKKSFRLVDPEFSSTFAPPDYTAAAGAAGGSSSVVLQDWESETESSKPPSLRLRSKRRRRATSQLSPPKHEPSFEPEPVSSVSDTTPEEDVALCLMMLSRDVWTTAGDWTRSNRGRFAEEEAGNEEEQEEEEEEEEEYEGEEEQPWDDSEEKRTVGIRSRRGTGRGGRYQCGTCRKVFRSYQALGGHRASHKKSRACVVAPPPVVVDVGEAGNGRRRPGTQIRDADSELNAAPSAAGSADRRIHECPFCFRVFSSGQALGGHKRSHLPYSSAGATNPGPVLVVPNYAVAAPPDAPIPTTAAATSFVDVKSSTKFAGESFIDLNLPAPLEEEVEFSAVCDGER